MSLQSSYPDILGQLADARRTVDGVLQCALGIFPTTTALDRPVEVLLLLQNLTDRRLPLAITVEPPRYDAAGGLLNIFTPRPRITLALPPAECGLLHIPVTPQLPTPTGQHYTVSISVAVETPAAFLQVRPTDGGSAPSMLALSPFRLAVLREINYAAHESEPGKLDVSFEVLPGRFPPEATPPQPRYESLWTLRDLQPGADPDEMTAAEALTVSLILTRDTVAMPLLRRTDALYAEAGIPLHPGEAIFITRMLTYVIEDGLDHEQGFSRAGSHWIERLGRLLSQEPGVAGNLERLVRLLYTAVVQDAAMLAFKLIAYEITRADFGDVFEQTDYTTRLVSVLEGRAPASLEHVYVPLVLGGVLIQGRLFLPGEKPWRSLNQVRQARSGRVKLAGSGFKEVFTILDTLAERSERLLRERKIPRD